MAATISGSGRRSLGGTIAMLGAAALLVVACGGRSPAQLASEALNDGLAAHNAGNLDEAARLYRECLAHEPTNKFCLFDLGVIAQAQGRTAEAENYYRLSLAADPGYGPALFNLAVLRVDAGDNTGGRDLYQQYVSVFPDDADGRLNLGLVLIALGDNEAGQAQIAEAQRLDPSISVPPPSTSPTASPPT